MSYAYALVHGYGDLYSASYPDAIVVIADIKGPSKTRQEFSEECDINNIMARYEASGVWPFKEDVPPVYLDFVAMPDLQDAMQHMFSAQEAFARLPALARKEFDNDPVRFVEFASDPANLERMRTWGLAEPEKAPDEPQLVRIVPEAAAPPIVPAKP